MPLYEFRCRACGTTFTVQRPMIASSDPAACPEGHPDTTRLLSMAGTIAGSRTDTPEPRSGGCCGGGCCA
jgi:putative FmdB family regulatory protein